MQSRIDEANARHEAEMARNDLLWLKNYVERRLLYIQNKFNVRGAVEFIASKHVPRITTGVQAQLDHIAKSHKFKSILAEVISKREITPKTAERYRQNIYHSISKHFHPSGNAEDLIIDVRSGLGISHGDGSVLETIFRHDVKPYEYHTSPGTAAFVISNGELPESR